MWTKIRSGLAICFLVVAGIMITSGQVIAALRFPAMDGTGVATAAKYFSMGIFAVFVLVPLLIGLALESFRRWQKRCGIVFLSACGMAVLDAVSFACMYYSPDMRFVFERPNASPIAFDPWFGALYFGINVLCGVLFLLWHRKTLAVAAA